MKRNIGYIGYILAAAAFTAAGVFFRTALRGYGFLALVMFGAGLSMVLNYFRLKRRGLVSVKAEITDIYKRQISRATKILRADKFTYYPIVRSQLDGKDCLRRCNINSGSEKSFTVGDTMTLYTDPKTGVVLEHGARLGFAIFGAVLLILGILVGLSTLSVL